MFPKTSDFQNYCFKIEVMKKHSKKALSTGHHDNGTFLEVASVSTFFELIESHVCGNSHAGMQNSMID